MEKELLIKNLYENGLPMKQIQKECSCGDATIRKVIAKYNLPPRQSSKNRKEPLDEDKICELYKKGVTNIKIAKECKCSTNTISKVLDRHGIPKRSEQFNKKSKHFEKFYDLTSPETQYWIGYICADGSIQYDPKLHNYAVRLYSKDKEIIDKFSDYFGKDVVSIYDKAASGVIMAYISSKELCEYFINTLNIVPNKALVLNPNVEYTKNFILGYFDGDGCIRNTSSDGQTRYECNITSGSKIFLEKIKAILDSNNIYSILYEHTDCNAYKIRIDRKEDSRKFYKWLYSEAVTCLSRKLNNFVHLFGNIENKNLGELGENPITEDNTEPSIGLTSCEGVTTNS